MYSMENRRLEDGPSRNDLYVDQLDATGNRADSRCDSTVEEPEKKIKEKPMEEFKGCKRKEKRTITSRLTNITPTKRKACKVWIPEKCSLKDKFPPAYLQKYGNCTSNAVLGCDDMIYHGTGNWIPSTTFTYWLQKRKEKPLVDDGSSIEIALKMTKKYGACDSKCWANDAPWNKRPSEEAFANGLKGKKIKSWYEIKNLKQLKQAIACGYPVAAAFAWCFKGYDENFVLDTPTKKDADNAPTGHAVVVVGYDDTTKCIEIRNSWSDQWCNNGYAYMTYDAVKACAWWDDTYAVTR